MGAPSIAVVGATGAVGEVFLSILEQRGFPFSSIRLFASERSVGKRITVAGQEHVVETVGEGAFDNTDVVFISASGAVSRALAPVAAASGALVIDDSSVFRMEPSVPLIVPEVNAGDLEDHRGIVSIPNCSTTPLVMCLYPLHLVNPIRRIVVDTYQSVSGTGRAAVEELRGQSENLLQGLPISRSVYPHQIAFNAFPHIEPFQDNGYTNEEMKMRNETRKIMHAPDLAVSATCVRIPVYVSHSEALHVEFTHPISPHEARELMAAFPGVHVQDDLDSNTYPMPWEAAGNDDVYVGRVRQDISIPNGLAMWIVSDNLRKGAALNALQIAEEAVCRELVHPRQTAGAG